MVAPFIMFYGRSGVGFCFKTGKCFFLEVLFNTPLFERFACFYVTISGTYELFQYFNFHTDFLERGNLFLNSSTDF